MYWIQVRCGDWQENPQMGREGWFIWWSRGSPYLRGRICNTIWAGDKLNQHYICQWFFCLVYLLMDSSWRDVGPSWGGQGLDIVGQVLGIGWEHRSLKVGVRLRCLGLCALVSVEGVGQPCEMLGVLLHGVLSWVPALGQMRSESGLSLGANLG